MSLARGSASFAPPSNNALKLTSSAALEWTLLAADMERPLSSLSRASRFR